MKNHKLGFHISLFFDIGLNSSNLGLPNNTFLKEIVICSGMPQVSYSKTPEQPLALVATLTIHNYKVLQKGTKSNSQDLEKSFTKIKSNPSVYMLYASGPQSGCCEDGPWVPQDE